MRADYMIPRVAICQEVDCRIEFTFVGKCAARCPACKEKARTKRMQNQCKMRRERGAALNGGDALGKHNKDLESRLRPLVLRSHKQVGRLLGISSEAVRQIELRALEKIRVFLDPYKRNRVGREVAPESLPALVVGLPVPTTAGRRATNAQLPEFTEAFVAK